MPVDRKRILELALENLMGEKARIDAEIAEVRAQLHEPAGKTKAKPAATRKTAKRGTRSNQNAKVASSMKKLWDKVHKAGFTNLKDYKASLNG